MYENWRLDIRGRLLHVYIHSLSNHKEVQEEPLEHGKEEI